MTWDGGRHELGLSTERHQNNASQPQNVDSGRRSIFNDITTIVVLGIPGGEVCN